MRLFPLILILQFLSSNLVAQDIGEFFERSDRQIQATDMKSWLNEVQNIGHELDRKGDFQTANRLYLFGLRKSAKASEEKIVIFNRLAVNYWRLNKLDSALYYNELSISDNIKLQLIEYQADAISMRGLLYYQTNDYPNSIIEYLKAIELYKGIDKKSNLGATKLNLAITYKKISLYEKAIEQLVEAVDLYRELEDTRNLSSCLNSLADTYNKLGQYNKSLNYHFEALENRIALDDSARIASSLNNIGIVYLGMDSASQAIDFLYRSLAIKKKLRNNRLIASSLENIGEIYMRLNETDSAELNYLKAETLASEAADKLILASVSNKLAELYLAQNETAKAYSYLMAAKELANQMQTLEVLRQNLEITSRYYEQNSQPKKALNSYREQALLRDSILNIEKQRALTEMEVRFETAQREREIDNLNQQSLTQKELLSQQERFIYVLVALALLLIALAYITYSRYRLKSKAISHIKNLMDELNHRVKNNLQVISSLLKIQSFEMDSSEAKEAMLESRNRVAAMGLIHQRLYQKDGANSIYMSEYLTDLVTNLIRSFGYDIEENKIEIDAGALNLDVDTAVPIGLIINELTCNALKYAFEKGRKNQLLVNLTQEEKHLVLQVSDNGDKGFNKKDESDSFGMSLIESLARELEAEIEYQNGTGTKVTLNIKKFKLSKRESVVF